MLFIAGSFSDTATFGSSSLVAASGDLVDERHTSTCLTCLIRALLLPQWTYQMAAPIGLCRYLPTKTHNSDGGSDMPC